jgi:hypothetical protein
MRRAFRESFQPAHELAGKNRAFCRRADNSDWARPLKAPQATFSL